jgi:hypothetical protein
MVKYRCVLRCCKGSIDDSKKVYIPGELTVCPGSKKLLLCVTGVYGRYRDYLPYFVDKLGKDFNVYVTELRNKGMANVDNCARDLIRIEQGLRKTLGLEDVVYIAHSMGMNVVARSRKFSDSKIRGFYGCSAYPSAGDTRTASENLEERGLQQRVIDLISRLNFGQIGSQLKEHIFEEPVRFAIPGNDELLKTSNPQVLKRFEKYFMRNPKGSTRVFEGFNHCFNYSPHTLTGLGEPFNKDNPDLLVDDIKNFADQV